MTTATIQIAPSFAQSTEICIAALENGTAEGKRMARTELRRYAAELDRLAAQSGASFDTADTPTSED